MAKAKAAAPAGAPAAAVNAPPSGLPATKRLYLTYEGNFQLQCVGTVLWSSAVTTAADGAAFLAQARRAGGRRAPAADADHATGALERCRAALATVLAAKPGPYDGLNFKVVV